MIADFKPFSVNDIQFQFIKKTSQIFIKICNHIIEILTVSSSIIYKTYIYALILNHVCHNIKGM